MTEILDRIDETLTYYSASLGEDVTVAVEHGWLDSPERVTFVPRTITEQVLAAAARNWYGPEVLDAPARLRAALVRVELDADRFAAAMTRAAQTVADSLARIAARDRADGVRAAAERRARLRRMHVAYRRRGRW